MTQKIRCDHALRSHSYKKLCQSGVEGGRERERERDCRFSVLKGKMTEEKEMLAACT